MAPDISLTPSLGKKYSDTHFSVEAHMSIQRRHGEVLSLPRPIWWSCFHSSVWEKRWEAGVSVRGPPAEHWPSLHTHRHTHTRVHAIRLWDAACLSGPGWNSSEVTQRCSAGAASSPCQALSRPSCLFFSLCRILSPYLSFFLSLLPAFLVLFLFPSPLLVLHLPESDWNRCLRGRQDMCVSTCVHVCMCVRACTASTNWLICDMRTTAASHRWGRDKRGRQQEWQGEAERKKGESGRDGEKWKTGKRGGERIKCWWEKRERVGDPAEGEPSQPRLFSLMRPLLNIDRASESVWTQKGESAC